MRLIANIALLIFILIPLQAVKANDISPEFDNSYDPDMEGIEIQEVNDPFEPFNRNAYNVYRGIDTMIVGPVSQIYGYIVPDYFKERVRNALNNLNEPIAMANSALQLNPDSIGISIGRFLVNTIFGLGGLFDVASEIEGLDKPVKTGFSSTLKYYGVPVGPYLVLPIIGPTSLRDAPAMAVDSVMDPYNLIASRDASIARLAIGVVSKRYEYADVIEHMEKTSLDSYVTMRSIYLQKH
jgi:phospholipid-binding lipoprotein MlaA